MHGTSLTLFVGSISIGDTTRSIVNGASKLSAMRDSSRFTRWPRKLANSSMSNRLETLPHHKNGSSSPGSIHIGARATKRNGERFIDCCSPTILCRHLVSLPRTSGPQRPDRQLTDVSTDPEYAEDFQPMGAESRNFLEFQHYLLTEMPRLFTQAAYEYAGQHIQDQVVLRVDDVNKIIEDTLQQAYDTWTLQGRLLPPNISPSISMREFPATPATQVGHSTSMPSTTWSETPMAPPPYIHEQSATPLFPNTSAPEYALFSVASDMDNMLSLDDLDITVSNPVGSAPSYTSNGYMTTGPDVQYTGAGFFPYGTNTGENQNWF